MANAVIRRRINEEMAKARQAATVDLAECVRLLSEDIRHPESQADRVRAVAQLSKMSGWDKQAETKTTVEIDGFMVGGKVEDANG